MSMIRTVDWQWENATVGTVAGLATVTFSHSLDVVRTRFQVNDGWNNLPLYTNTHHALFTIARTEHVAGPSMKVDPPTSKPRSLRLKMASVNTKKPFTRCSRKSGKRDA